MRGTMIRISEAAQAHFSKLLADQPDGTNIRVFVVNPGTTNAECGVSYCPPDSVEATDIRLSFSGFDAVVDEASTPFLEEAEIDLIAVRAEREKLKAQLAELEGEMAKYLEELGYGA